MLEIFKSFKAVPCDVLVITIGSILALLYIHGLDTAEGMFPVKDVWSLSYLLMKVFVTVFIFVVIRAGLFIFVLTRFKETFPVNVYGLLGTSVLVVALLLTSSYIENNGYSFNLALFSKIEFIRLCFLYALAKDFLSEARS